MNCPGALSPIRPVMLGICHTCAAQDDAGTAEPAAYTLPSGTKACPHYLSLLAVEPPRASPSRGDGITPRQASPVGALFGG